MPVDQPELVESLADRLVREAMEAGDFDDLPGSGKPIPGAGIVDDDLWWVRGWVRRNLDQGADEPSSSS